MRPAKDFLIFSCQTPGNGKRAHKLSSGCVGEKVYLGDGLVCSIGSEFVENSEKDRERYVRSMVGITCCVLRMEGYLV